MFRERGLSRVGIRSEASERLNSHYATSAHGLADSSLGTTGFKNNLLVSPIRSQA